MRRPMLALTLSIGIGLGLVACVSPAGSSGESASSEPSAPASQSESPAESEPAASDGAASQGEAPALADGPWTGGRGQTTVSGAVSHTTDAPITTERSSTQQAKTLLAYNTDDAFVTIFINLTGVPFHADVTTNEFSALSDTCEVTYARADDTGIDATFSCVVDEFHWLTVGDPPTGQIKIEGSFTATR